MMRGKLDKTYVDITIVYDQFNRIYCIMVPPITCCWSLHFWWIYAAITYEEIQTGEEKNIWSSIDKLVSFLITFNTYILINQDV